MNRKLQNDSIMLDFRASFYALKGIKVMSIGESWQIAPYDAFWYFQYPDATILPSLTNTSKIKKFLPWLGFDDENSAKKRLEGFMLKVEAQMGGTYVIRNVSMGAQNVYTMVDENNIDCIKLIGNGLFAKVDKCRICKQRNGW